MSRRQGRDVSALRFRIAFAITAMVTLGIAVILPFSVQSIVDDVLGPATGSVTAITKTPLAADAAAYCRLHLAVVDIDEAQLMATLRISGHCRCRAACDESYRIVIASVAADDADAEGMPPSVAIVLHSSGEGILENVELPIRGHPVRYPFDHYDMVLGIAFQRVAADGTIETLTSERVAGHLAMSIQELLPRQIMSAPVSVDPASIREEDDSLTYAYAFGVSFDRPRYLRLLSVILVLLIAAAAAYAVFLRPLQDSGRELGRAGARRVGNPEASSRRATCTT